MTTENAMRLKHIAVEVAIAVAIVFALVAYAMFPVRLGISRNWLAFAGETLIIAVNIVGFMRKQQTPSAGWWLSGAALAVHLAVGGTVCAYVEDIPLIWFAIAGTGEVLLLLALIQRMGPRIGKGTPR